MKTSIRKNAYAVTSESYTLAERIHVQGKHGRDRKQHYLSKQARLAAKIQDDFGNYIVEQLNN